MRRFNIQKTPMTVRRGTGDDALEFEIRGSDLGTEHGLTFAVDADIELGDEVSYSLPNGKRRTMKILDVNVLQNPFVGGSTMDHTAARYMLVSEQRPGQQIEQAPGPVELPGLHPTVSAVSGRAFAQAHYDSAIFEAFKAVEHRVQSLTGSAKSGKPLVTSVFNEQQPQLDTSSLSAAGAQRADELEGFKYLFMGATQGVRNTRAHGAQLGTSKEEAHELLALASFLLRGLDRAEARQVP